MSNREGSREGKLVEVYRAAGEAEAHIIKGLLEANGIESVLRSNTAPSVHVFAIGCEVSVMVVETMAEEAKNLISGKEDNV